MKRINLFKTVVTSAGECVPPSIICQHALKDMGGGGSIKGESHVLSLSVYIQFSHQIHQTHHGGEERPREAEG